MTYNEGDIIGYAIVARQYDSDVWQSGEELSDLSVIEEAVEQENLATEAAGFGDIVIAEVRVVRKIT